MFIKLYTRLFIRLNKKKTNNSNKKNYIEREEKKKKLQNKTHRKEEMYNRMDKEKIGSLKDTKKSKRNMIGNK